VSFTATGKKNRKVKLELKEAATLQQASSQMGMGHGRPVPSLSSQLPSGCMAKTFKTFKSV